MATLCFCGCGRTIPRGPRMNAGNRMGAEMDRDLRLFRGALERDENDPEDEAALRHLVDRGTVLRDEVRDVVHGASDRKSADRAGRMSWVGSANKQRGRLWGNVSKAGFPGLDAARDADLVYAGGIAPGRVVAVDDTGMTLNNAPKIRVRLRVQPGGDPPFEVERKLFVSRVMLPPGSARPSPSTSTRATMNASRFGARTSLTTPSAHPPPPPSNRTGSTGSSSWAGSGARA